MDAAALDPQRLQLLEEALNSLLVTLQPDQESDAARRLVVTDVQQLVSQSLRADYHCSVETFGSFRAGLHLPGSDLDFALNGWVADRTTGRQVELHEWSANEQQYLLQDLADALEREQLVQGKVERVLHARVPVIKFIHALTGLRCDFSIHRPECCFKADMQKLLGSLDRRYATLYRLVKAWANAHGLNDAAANTLNSWSLGLMVAFYLQCETPQVLPPIWQLLEQQQPSVAAPRILQQPGITSATLKRALNHAAAGAGAFIGRRAREGPAALNPKGLAALLAGFFAFFAPQLSQWAAGQAAGRRASTWWGAWMDAGWSPTKAYIFSIEDPFHAGDNTARSVGTHNHLSSCNTASYIASCFATSADQLHRALSSSSSGSSSNGGGGSSSDAGGSSAGEPAGSQQQGAELQPGDATVGSPGAAAAAARNGSGSSSGSSSSSSSGGGSSSDAAAAAAREVLSAFAWLFGPHAVLQADALPPPLAACLCERVPDDALRLLRAEVARLDDCLEALSHSSSLVNACNSNSSGGGGAAAVAARAARVEAALAAYKQLAGLLGCAPHEVCLRDYLVRKRAIDKQQQMERERERQRWLQQQQEWQKQQHQQVMAAMHGLSMGQPTPAPPPAAPGGAAAQRQQQQHPQRFASAPPQYHPHPHQQPGRRHAPPPPQQQQQQQPGWAPQQHPVPAARTGSHDSPLQQQQHHHHHVAGHSLSTSSSSNGSFAGGRAEGASGVRHAHHLQQQQQHAGAAAAPEHLQAAPGHPHPVEVVQAAASRRRALATAGAAGAPPPAHDGRQRPGRQLEPGAAAAAAAAGALVSPPGRPAGPPVGRLAASAFAGIAAVAGGGGGRGGRPAAAEQQQQQQHNGGGRDGSQSQQQQSQQQQPQLSQSHVMVA